MTSPEPASLLTAGSSSELAETPPQPTIRIGSRQSALALIQTSIVHKALEEAWPNLTYEVRAMKTAGDKNLSTPLHDFGAKALWTYELEALLLDGKLDLIVHSLKGGAALRLGPKFLARFSSYGHLIAYYVIPQIFLLNYHRH